MLWNFRPAIRQIEFGADYRAYYLARDVRHTCLAIAVWLIPILIFGYSDYSVFGWGEEFFWLSLARSIFLVSCLGVITLLLRTSQVKQYDLTYLCWALLAVTFVLFINYMWASYVPPNADITILILFCAYMMSPPNLLARFIPPILLSLGNMFLEWNFIAVIPYNSGSAWVAIIMANVLGAILSTYQEKHRHAEFQARLEEARAKEELRRLAQIDYLTGIFNRRQLVQLASQEFEKFQQGESSFSVFMFDINDFKQINDCYGHDAGDAVLCDLAVRIAERHFTNGAIWGRLGGDEFVLILLRTTGEQARMIAEEIGAGIGRTPVFYGGQPLHYAVSIGVTQARKTDLSLEQILKRADTALYRVKRNEGNMIVVL